MSTATGPNEVAARLTGRDYLSYSAISTFRSCPLRYYFRYVAGLPEEVVSASLVFGGAVHAAVELHFNELLAGNPPPTLDMLLDAYQDAWRQREPEAIRFSAGDDVNSLGRLAERMLAAFQGSGLARPRGKILGVEEELRGEVVEGCPELLARVDLIEDAGESLLVTDLKTARNRWSEEQVESSAEQLLLYSELASQLAPEKALRLQFAVITKARQPRVDLHEVALDPQRVERAKRVVERVWEAIQAGHIYPSPSPLNCSGCPFRGPCRSWDG